MAYTWRYLKRNCPVCNGVRRDCRENTSTGLIHCRCDEVSSVPGLKFVGQDVLGFNMWAPDTGAEIGYSASLEFQREYRRTKKEQQVSRFTHCLSVQERDRQFRLVLQWKATTLTPRHVSHLIEKRQLITDEVNWLITQKWVRTWEPGIKTPVGIKENLPGISPDGFLLGRPGFTIAALDPDSHITGMQIATLLDDPKYIWLSSAPLGGNGPQLPNGELPLFCWKHPNTPQIKTVILCEGALKSMLVALLLWRVGQHDIAVIGTASAARYGSKTLSDYLKRLGANDIRLMPDAGARANRHIAAANQQTLEWLVQWGYHVTVGDWGQLEDKSQPDFDELLAAFRGNEVRLIHAPDYLAGVEKTAHSFNAMAGLLSQLKHQLQKARGRLKAWGFGKKGSVELETSSTTPKQTVSYQALDRLTVWSQAIKSGAKFLCDSSATGTGKSFDSGRLHTEQLDCRQIIFATKEHRNPATSTLSEWTHLEARHGGLKCDRFGKQRRVKIGESYSISPNCSRVNTIDALRSLNVSGADCAELICQTCPFLEACRVGAVYGYLSQRREALKSPRIIASPESLPEPIDAMNSNGYDYSQTAIIWDEWSENLRVTQTLTVTQHDINQMRLKLDERAPGQYQVLKPLLMILAALLSGEIPAPNRKYGWSHAAILEHLPSLPDFLDLEEIEQTIAFEPSLINTTLEYGISLADLPASARKKLTCGDETTAIRVEKEVIKQWIVPFVGILQGNPGALRIRNRLLTVTLPDQRLVRIARAAKANIFLDATGDRAELAALLGISPQQLLCIRKEQPNTDNLELIQVASLGRLGMNRGNSQIRRVEAVVDHIQNNIDPKAAVADFKKFGEQYQDTGIETVLKWWVETRGMNDFEQITTLILIGTPCRDLGALESEFITRTGRAPLNGTLKVKYPIQVKGAIPEDIQPYFEMEVSADLEFRAFVRRRILADIHQAIGRLRTHRRPGEKLIVYFLGDYPLDIPVTLVRASDITPEAADKTERVELAIKAAVEQLQTTGQKITTTAIAFVTGYSQQHISRFRDLLKMLIESPNSQMSKTTQKTQEAQWLVREYLPLVASLPEFEMLQEVATLLSVYGRSNFEWLFEATPALTQIAILAKLMLTLPMDCLRQLTSATVLGLNLFSSTSVPSESTTT